MQLFYLLETRFFTLFISLKYNRALLFNGNSLCNKHTSATNSFDLLFGRFAEELCLYNHGLLGQSAFSENLVVALQTV